MVKFGGVAAAVLVLLSLTTEAMGQASVDSNKKIESFHVVSDIRYRFATTQMVSVVKNTADRSQEVTFDVTLPKEAFIIHFDMAIDGEMYEGEVKEKKAAQQKYQAAVDRGQSAGHVGQSARHANLFDVSVNIASGSTVNFTLTYQELLRRRLGLYHHEVHVKPGQPVEDFLVKVYIKDKVPITMIKTPSVKTDFLITNDAEEKIPDFVSVVQRNPNTAYVEYIPTLSEQGEGGLNARFLLQYDVEHNEKGDLMVVDGYFVHYLAPSLPPMPKDIIFVLDKSGSMMGEKINQLKTAIKSILKDLRPNDRFNIINFSDSVHTWRHELYPADNATKEEAIEYVDIIGAHGGTNIHRALMRAVQSTMLRSGDSRAPIVFFLTDGQATTGKTNSGRIKDDIRRANEGVVAIFSLAFGHDADYELLKGISAQNSGFARKIYEASDSALQVSTLYKEISAVVMKDLQINYLNSSVDEYTITRTKFPVVFNGTEIIVSGKLDNQSLTYEMDITGLQKDGEVNLRFETNDVTEFEIEEELVDPIDGDMPKLFRAPRDYSGIVERMWAFLTIKQLLKERERGAGSQTRDNEIKQKIIDMAVEYKFVTPLTSMVVTRPEDEDGQFKERVESGLKDVDELASDTPYAASYSHARKSFSQQKKSRLLLSSPSRPISPGGARRPGSTFQRLPLRTGSGASFMDLYGLAMGRPILNRPPPHIQHPKHYKMDDEDEDDLDGFLSSGTSRPRHRTTTTTTTTTTTRPPVTRTSSGRGGGRRGGRRVPRRPSAAGRGRGRRARRGRRGRRGKKDSRKRTIGGKRRRHNGQPKLILAALIFDRDTRSYCVVPRKWPAGNYSVLERPSGGNPDPYPVLLNITSVGRGRRVNTLRSLVLSDRSVLNLENLYANGWQYVAGPDTEVSVVGGAVRMEQSGKMVVTAKVMKKTPRAWYLALTFSGDFGDGGTSFTRAVRSRRTKRVREWCGLTKRRFTVMGMVSKRKAKKFLVK